MSFLLEKKNRCLVEPSLEQVHQEGCGSTLLVVQGQGFEQPDVVEHVPAHGMGIGTR